MRVLRSVLAAAITLAVLAAPVSAAPASTGDYVWGGGFRLSNAVVPQPRVQFFVAAAALDGHAFGLYSYRHLVIDLKFGGPITCFDIEGNQAAIGGVITRLTGADKGSIELGNGFLVFLIDNGAGTDVVSQTYILPGDADAGNVAVPDDFPRTCPDAAETAHDEFKVQGNFVVRDR